MCKFRQNWGSPVLEWEGGSSAAMSVPSRGSNATLCQGVGGDNTMGALVQSF